MFYPHYEASAPTAKVTPPSVSKTSLRPRAHATPDHYREPASPTAKVSGQECYASTPPATWRNRHRRPPKNKAPITKAQAIEALNCQRQKLQALLSKHLAQAEARAKNPSDWDSNGLIDERTCARLLGGIWQSSADLIARISDADEGARRKAHKRAFRLSKVGYGRLRAKQAALPSPVPDHVVEWNGDYLLPSIKYYRAMIGFCSKAIKMVEQL